MAEGESGVRNAGRPYDEDRVRLCRSNRLLTDEVIRCAVATEHGDSRTYSYPSATSLPSSTLNSTPSNGVRRRKPWRLTANRSAGWCSAEQAIARAAPTPHNAESFSSPERRSERWL